MTKEPIIIAFCCHYCAFTAADLAGTMRLQYPANLRIVRLPCTGKADANMILEAFVEGADGVMVNGCEPGSCHFIQGNLRAARRVGLAKRLLAEAGINPERLEMFHIAASQGPLFAQTAREFTARIAKLMGCEAPEERKPETQGPAADAQAPAARNCRPEEPGCPKG